MSNSSSLLAGQSLIFWATSHRKALKFNCVYCEMAIMLFDAKPRVSGESCLSSLP